MGRVRIVFNTSKGICTPRTKSDGVQPLLHPYDKAIGNFPCGVRNADRLWAKVKCVSILACSQSTFPPPTKIIWPKDDASMMLHHPSFEAILLFGTLGLSLVIQFPLGAITLIPTALICHSTTTTIQAGEARCCCDIYCCEWVSCTGVKR